MNIEQQHEYADELLQFLSEIEIMLGGELYTLGKEQQGSIAIYLSDLHEDLILYATPFWDTDEHDDLLTINNYIDFSMVQDGFHSSTRVPYGAKFDNFADDVGLYVEKVNKLFNDGLEYMLAKIYNQYLEHENIYPHSVDELLVMADDFGLTEEQITWLTQFESAWDKLTDRQS